MLFTEDDAVMATLSASMDKMRGIHVCICIYVYIYIYIYIDKCCLPRMAQ